MATLTPTLVPSHAPTPPTTLSANNLPNDVRVRLAFHFNPNLDVAAMWIALFGAVTLVIAAQAVRYGGRFPWIIVATGVMEVIGYGTRIASAKAYGILIFIITSLCLLIAPILFAFVDYLVVGYLVMAAGKKVHVFFWEVSAQNIAKIFLASDLVCLFLQGAGGGMLAVDDINVVNIGDAVVMVGLIVQILFFSAFLWIILKLRFQHEYKLKYVLSLRPLFWGLGLTVGFMYVRNVYRIADFASISAHSWRDPGFLPSQESIFFGMESVPIFLAFVVYAIVPFQYYLGYHEKDKPESWRRELAEVEKKYSFQSASGESEDGAVAQKAAAEA